MRVCVCVSQILQLERSAEVDRARISQLEEEVNVSGQTYPRHKSGQSEWSKKSCQKSANRLSRKSPPEESAK